VARELLGEILERAGLTRVVLVAPSMSGRFAFDYFGAGGERVAGFVGIAPVGGESFQPPSPWRVPTLLLWGAADAVIPVERGHELAERLAGARLEILEGASHACYLDQPERFHALLLEFLATALPSER